jgi:hypothetical protein
MIPIKNGFIPARGYVAMTVWPLLFIRKEHYPIGARTQRHEDIHARQQKEMGVVLFFAWYGVEWLIRRLFGKGNAYRNISFEREAYSNQDNEMYLNIRKRFAWVSYIINKTG